MAAAAAAGGVLWRTSPAAARPRGAASTYRGGTRARALSHAVRVTGRAADPTAGRAPRATQGRRAAWRRGAAAPKGLREAPRPVAAAAAAGGGGDGGDGASNGGGGGGGGSSSGDNGGGGGGFQLTWGGRVLLLSLVYLMAAPLLSDALAVRSFFFFFLFYFFTWARPNGLPTSSQMRTCARSPKSHSTSMRPGPLACSWPRPCVSSLKKKTGPSRDCLRVQNCMHARN